MKALIFDLDGTLIDSVYAHAIECQRKLGLPVFECVIVGDAICELAVLP
jgi:phosphoglycolate phosphatase-like HAD superfamily hydrolase